MQTIDCYLYDNVDEFLEQFEKYNWKAAILVTGEMIEEPIKLVKPICRTFFRPNSG